VRVQVYDDLITRAAEGITIRVGLVGAGFMGRGIVEVLELTPGMHVAAIADVDVARAHACFDQIGVSHVRMVEDEREGRSCDLSVERLICSDHRIVTALEGLDMVIEATGKPEVGARVAFDAIANGKHVGMLNVETDATVGYYLSSQARARGLVYTVCAGDEPAAVKELCDFAHVCGFTVVAAGKGKNNPLDHEATPESLSAQARRVGLNPSILTEFVDGSKTMVEMASVANASGLSVDKRNMHGPVVDIPSMHEVFRPREQGGVLGREGVVEYVIGDLAPGVFVVVRHTGPIANETLRYLKVGEGPYYLLYRPYHLTSLEVPDTVGWAVIHGRPTLACTRPPVTEVITIAKRDLRRGDYVDSYGGHTVYGGIENREQAAKENLLPLGLAVGARLREEVEKGSVVTYDQVELKPSPLLNFRKIQDSMHGEDR
jgi:predicted homoserine dehydrogenase-like protein